MDLFRMSGCDIYGLSFSQCAPKSIFLLESRLHPSAKGEMIERHNNTSCVGAPN